MKKLVTLMCVMTPVTAFAGPLTWVRETLFPGSDHRTSCREDCSGACASRHRLGCLGNLDRRYHDPLAWPKGSANDSQTLAGIPEEGRNSSGAMISRHRYCSHGVALAFSSNTHINIITL